MTQPTGALKGRLALVTGASRGLGAAVARRYAAEGAHVILAARTQGGLETVDDRIRAAGGTASVMPIDLTKPELVAGMGEALFARFGALDVVAACHGQLSQLKPLGHFTKKQWDTMVNANLTSTWLLVQAVDPLLRQSAAGRLIYATCGQARTPEPFWAHQAATKAAAEALIKTYAQEVAKGPVRANLVDPGPMLTPLRRTAYPGQADGDAPNPDDDPAVLTDPFVALARADADENGSLMQSQA